MNMQRAAIYLQISSEYCRSFGGLRWAHYGEAVEFLHGPEAGRTFAFAGEIALFLEGMHASGVPVPCFGAVLHLLYLVGLGDRAILAACEASIDSSSGDPFPHFRRRCIERIASPFRELGAPLRNAGALAGWICRDLTPTSLPLDVRSVVQLLSQGSWVPQMVLSDPSLGVTDHAERPPFEPATLEARVRHESEALSAQAIRHWLRHGCAPAVATQAVALLRELPNSYDLHLAEFEQRARLVGISRLVGCVDSALTLPPRRLRRANNREGGYSDLTTSGQPEQILPFQFALDDQEFLRRYAERELLYYDREEPGLLATEEMIVLLDQGLRTWGETRIALAAAAVALTQRARRRQLPLILTTTSSHRTTIDATSASSQAIAELLESSDLSPNPAEAFARLVNQPPDKRRDLIVLTHPRSLAEPELIAAALTPYRNGLMRLFAVTLDAEGQFELSALEHGRPIVLTRARISLASQPRASASVILSAAHSPSAMWTGDVEPIPFPFHCEALEKFSRHRAEHHSSAGSRGRDQLKTTVPVSDAASDDPSDSDFDRYRTIDFDIAGDRMIAMGKQYLYAWRLETASVEILPRPRVDDSVPWPWSTIIGVVGGFLLVRASGETQYLAHYDFRTRHCKIHTVENAAHPIAWSYYPDLHSIAGRPRGEGHCGLAFDLNPRLDDPETTPRASRAIARIEAGRTLDHVTVPEIPKGSEYHRIESYRRVLWLDAANGTIEYRRELGRKSAWVPLVDGHPALIGGVILCARRGGDVLGLLVQGKMGRNLFFVSVSGATVLGIVESHVASRHETFALSHDGTRFARINRDLRIEATAIPGNLAPVLVTGCEELRRLALAATPSGLLVRALTLNPTLRWGVVCLIRWHEEELEMTHGGPEMPLEPSAETKNRSGDELAPIRPALSARFGGLTASSLRPNHLDFFDSGGRIVCIMYVGRTESAAWLPDGTRFGATRLIGGEPTPGGAERIAAVLREAERKVQPA